MSYPHWNPTAVGNGHVTSGDLPVAAANGTAVLHHPLDAALDAALRGVPLPDGLLNRLHAMVLSMPDESTGQVDYLGC